VGLAGGFLRHDLRLTTLAVSLTLTCLTRHAEARFQRFAGAQSMKALIRGSPPQAWK
jgi:hypothetical protein